MLEVDIKIAPEELDDHEAIFRQLARAGGLHPSSVRYYRIIRRSLDARYRPPLYQLRALLSTNEMLPDIPRELDKLRDVSREKEVYIIGAGPAGYFAALECIRLGLRPIVLERGKDVRTRRRDLRAIQQEGIVNPHSNYCFGEGGAGTYSDGKLYTRSSKRGKIESVLQILTECGADPDIRIDAHPHIGSNKLPGIIANMRKAIEAHGGEVVFDAHVSDMVITGTVRKRVSALEINGSERVSCDHVILATGHSARDIFQLLLNHGVYIEPKPYALGVRIEHAQQFIDQCQYGMSTRGENLPAASYALNAQAGNRGVFSFCMCPGGLIVPAATAPGEIVVNGMSLSRRDSPYANSGIVTSIEKEDLEAYAAAGVLSGVALQREVEQRMYEAGNGTQAAPAQRLTDFLQGIVSRDVPESSYIPGLISAPVHELLPPMLYVRLAHGIKMFESKMQGYISYDAVVVAPESRTSSPVRIPRDPVTGMHIEIAGLYPCGEGAGYAGGIVSAAMDGQFIARCVQQQVASIG